MVGNLRQVKGPDLFIRAAQRVLEKHPDTQFEIAGGGDPLPYQTLIDELGLTNQVRLLGAVTDVPTFLGTLDVAVLPSRAEGLSNALLEYMAAGRPIVATDVGGNAELIESGVNGLLVKPSELELETAISQLLVDDDKAASLATASSGAAQRFEVRHLTKQLARIYGLHPAPAFQQVNSGASVNTLPNSSS